MVSNFKKKKFLRSTIISFCFLSLIIATALSNNFSNYSSLKERTVDFKNPENPHVAAQETFTTTWLENPTFEDPIEPTWYSKIDGDMSDIRLTTSPGQANYIVIGNAGKVRIDEPLSDTDWTAYSNPDLPILPDTYEINSAGCYVSHVWDEDVNQTRNRPSVQWKRNINTAVNFSDYIITSASLDVNFNATVTVSPHDTGGIDREGDAGLDVYSTGDYAYFYVLLSDIDQTFDPIQVAFNNTGNLGRDSPPISNYPDTPMSVVPEDVLISVLTSILGHDGHNFTITLGIDIYCEDNEIGADVDRWNSLIIRNFNLTFSYEKKINQLTVASWKQDSEKIADISNDTVIIDEAKLNFKYKIDESWTSSSPNSEIRAFINNNKLSETIKLSNANSSFQIAKSDGFDVTSLIPYNVGINLSIQVYLADEFGLNKNTTISIDDVYLNITYTVIFPDTQTNLQIFFNGVNKTNNPIFNIPLNEDINITIKYPDDVGAHISGAIVQLSGDLTGILTEDTIFGQYTIIIPANTLDVKTYYFDVVASRINYEARKISPILSVTKIPVDNLQLLLNGDDKSTDPFLEISLNQTLNMTIKYKDLFGEHISGASVELSGELISRVFDEDPSKEQYLLFLNTSDLVRGINELTISAEGSEEQKQTINPIITVRKINAKVTAVESYNKITVLPGGNAAIKIYINNTDFNVKVRGALVSANYKGETNYISLTDEDNDGIYEGIIFGVPKGIHTIVVSAVGSNIYNFESLEITITAEREAGNTLLFMILTIIGIVTAIAVAGYLYAYQKVLKYPKTVRKVRKYRKRLNRKNAPHMDIKNREKAFNSAYENETSTSSKYLRGKPSSVKTETPPQKVSSKIEKGGTD
ncbi:MAG: hypothetical protein ACFFCI_01565 [Promethearchaeota archaeon]